MFNTYTSFCSPCNNAVPHVVSWQSVAALICSTSLTFLKKTVSHYFIL